MSAISNLADPERFRLVAEHLRDCIDAELVDLEYVPRDTWDGEGFDVLGAFVCLWKRDYLRGQAGVPGWGTHRGCLRRKLGGAITIDLHNGHYDMGEESAKSDFFDRQTGLG